MFRLYLGLNIGDDWYNHAVVSDMKGGVLTMFDSVDMGIPAMTLNILKSILPEVYTEDGKKHEMSNSDYYKIRMIDAKQIVREYAKKASKGKHVFSESFNCPRCSKYGTEIFQTINEDWDELITDEHVYEYYAESADCSYETELPDGFELEEKGGYQGGKFNVVIREPMTLGDAIDITNTPNLRSIADRLRAKWDKEIKSIKGMNNKTFNLIVNKKGESFSKKYIVTSDDQEAIGNEVVYGMDFSNRVVRCDKCMLDIGGEADFTNFFLIFLKSKKSFQRRTGARITK